MKIKIYSLLVSIIFIPLAILGQFLGLYLGKVLYFIYDKVMFLRMPDFITDSAPAIISGFVAGCISAFVVTKIYKNYNLIFVMLIPGAIILFALLGDLLIVGDTSGSSNSIGSILREVITIGSYYYLLKDRYFLKDK